MSRRARLVVVGCTAAISGVLIYSLVPGLSAWGKPPILLVNQTEDHKYDRALRSSIRTFQDRTHIQLGIVLKDRLPPMTTIQSYAAETFKQAAVGERFGGKGILLLWSEQERLFKIEVAYELEPVFPDAICHRLEEGARTFMLAHSRAEGAWSGAATLPP